MSESLSVFLFILCIFVCSCTQVALKKAANKERSGIYIYLNKEVIISNVIFVGATLLTVFLFRYIQVSTASLLNGVNYIFVLVLSALILKEKITKKKILGMTLILAGVAVYAIFDRGV